MQQRGVKLNIVEMRQHISFIKAKKATLENETNSIMRTIGKIPVTEWSDVNRQRLEEVLKDAQKDIMRLGTSIQQTVKSLEQLVVAAEKYLR